LADKSQAITPLLHPSANDTVSRFPQLILILSTVLGSWLGMQAVHESGHVVGAWLTGGKVSRVVLSPLTISRTDLRENPKPSIVVWAGPLLGVVLPLVLWTLATMIRLPGTFVLRFFGGFCLLANGLYIGVGSFDGIGDCGTMLRHGSKPWQLWLFGLLTAPLGMWLWRGQGAHFGLGSGKGRVDQRAAYGSLIALVVLLALGFTLDGE
jgi:Peptidase M50B-like